MKFVYTSKLGHTTFISSTQKTKPIFLYTEARHVGPVSAIWGVFNFPRTYKYPSVIKLDVHLENEVALVFDEDEEKETLESIKEQQTTKSKLFQFFRNNLLEKQYFQRNRCNFYEGTPGYSFFFFISKLR